MSVLRGRAWAAERGSKALPSFIPAAGGNSHGHHAKEVQLCWGCRVLPVPPCVAGFAEQWEASGSVEGILLMLWLQSWLREKPGPKDLSPAGLGCLGAMPGRLRCPLQRRASSWRSAMLGPHWSVQLALYSCSGLKKTPVLQGARATLPSVELLCAAHCCESSGAAELPDTGPGRARLSRGASATHCRVQGIECSYDVWNRVYYSTWSQKEHGYFNDALAIF